MRKIAGVLGRISNKSKIYFFIFPNSRFPADMCFSLGNITSKMLSGHFTLFLEIRQLFQVICVISGKHMKSIIFHGTYEIDIVPNKQKR